MMFGPVRRLRSGWGSLFTILAVAGAFAPVALAGGLSAVETASGPGWTGAGPLPLESAVHQLQVDSLFPHLEHEGLFPLCSGCHEGIPEGDRATSFPESGLCAGCHDGVARSEVDWSPPAIEQGTLSFTHPQHIGAVTQAGDSPVDCAGCHMADGGGRMEIVPLQPDGCLSCHGPVLTSHQAQETDCATCHVAVAQVDAGVDWMASQVMPADHDEDFLGSHGPPSLASPSRCATCHVQDRCASCHVDAGLEGLAAVPAAPANWSLPPMQAAYPIPGSHTQVDFERVHGALTTAPSDCSTCHVQEDCASCHLNPLPTVAQALIPMNASHAPGVTLEPGLPGSHETPFFMTAHSLLAGASSETCAGCHTQDYCASCHVAPRAPGYHPTNFVARHPAEAGRVSADCSNCHETQTFCRTCHEEVGRGATGRLGSDYHDAEPLWLLRHGQPARQALETCASCHTQRDCLQCHSELGAFKISPHGPGFDPELAAAKNPWICRACHIGGAGVGQAEEQWK